MIKQERSRMRLIGLGGLTVITSLLLIGCSATGGYETQRTICRELSVDLPSYSVKDTPETLESGARFLDVFYAVCGEII